MVTNDMPYELTSGEWLWKLQAQIERLRRENSAIRVRMYRALDERDNARAWARLWKRAATLNRLDRVDYGDDWKTRRELWMGLAMPKGHWHPPWYRVIRRALGLAD